MGDAMELVDKLTRERIDIHPHQREERKWQKSTQPKVQDL